jgi:hypothetical protein
MKKWMLCVLALAMVGFTIVSAEAGGRRGRSYGGSVSSYSGSMGGGYAPYSDSWSGYGAAGGYHSHGGWSSQYAPASMMSSGYAVAYQGESGIPARSAPLMGSPIMLMSYEVNDGSSRFVSSGYPSAPNYPVYSSSFGGGFGAGCAGGG